MMRDKLIRTLVLCPLVVAVLFLPCSSGAEEEGGTQGNPWTFSFYFENDVFADTDRNYTNGVKLQWISPDLLSYAASGKLPDWGVRAVRGFPFINRAGCQRNIAFFLGQEMYTPEDISREDLILNDRPYGGWSYVGMAFHCKDENRLDTLEVQVGMVGPASQADKTQELVHRWRGIQLPMGWDHQIKNEPGLALVYERKWRLWAWKGPGGLGFDIIPHLGATVGNVRAYANIGTEARFGWNLPVDFGSALIRPGGETNAPASGRDIRVAQRGRFGFHLFGSLNGRGVARDIFLDGNSFTDSHSVDKEPFVGEGVVGVSVLLDRLKVSYAQVFQSKSYVQQDDSHRFGSISISFSY